MASDRTPDEMRCAELGETWRREIPLSVAMGVEIVSCNGAELTVEAPLAPNINLHGTAFAGSLYAIAALTGWGMVWLALGAHDLDATIVLAEAEVRYRKAVRDPIHCTSRFDASEQARALQRLAETGRSVFVVEAVVTTDGEEALHFAGKYAAKKR